MRTKARWRLTVPLGAALLVAATVLNFAPVAGAQSAGQAIEGFKGFSTAQDLHATVLDTTGTGTRVVNADEAWSGAAVDAGHAGLTGAKQDEEARVFQPSKPGKLTYARGSGVEVGLGTTPTDPNQVILAGFTDASAPPPTSKDTDLLGPLSAAPLAYASATRGQAVANANESGLVPDVCVIGDDLSRGLGYAADAQLVDTGSGGGPAGQLNTPLLGTDAPNGSARAVAQTISHEFLVPSGKAYPNNFGLASEVRETIAPISLLANEKTGVETLTVEVLGEWVLRAVATGHSGGASIFYGPGTINPETPVLRILPSSGNPTVLKLQDLLGNTGLDLPLDPVIHVDLGEAPRALAKPGAAPVYGSKPSVDPNGLFASAAVDVLRITSPALGIDVRLGHMEVSANSPEGGVNCPIPVTKTADPAKISIDQKPDTSTVSITVHNVFSCDLTSAVLTDNISKKVPSTGNPDFQLLKDSNSAIQPNSPIPVTKDDGTSASEALPTDNIRDANVTWNLGTVPKGTTKTVSILLKSATEGGIIEDVAHASGKLTNCTGSGAAGVAVNGLSVNNLDVSGISIPVDIVIETPNTGPNSRNTLATGVGLFGLALAGAFVMRRRRGTATP